MSFRDDGMTYINENGDTVFTSTFLRKKGRCCKSSCLHCPYGHTLNTIGVQIIEQTLSNTKEIKQLIEELVKTTGVTSSLLSEAFGAKPTFHDDDAVILSLKNVVCGIGYIKNKKVMALNLKEHFQEQGIDKAYIQSLIN